MVVVDGSAFFSIGCECCASERRHFTLRFCQTNEAIQYNPIEKVQKRITETKRATTTTKKKQCATHNDARRTREGREVDHRASSAENSKRTIEKNVP